MKIGVGIVTYQRFDRFKECFECLIRNSRDVEEIVVVDDCSEKDRDRYDAFFKNILFKNVVVYINSKNAGVATAKNKILKHFKEKNFDYIFTIEDDINVINPDVFKKYIEASVRSGYEYINFAHHGVMNKTHTTKIVNGFVLEAYADLIGAFSLHTKGLIEAIGYYDEAFFNAWEHVDYCYRASNKGLTSKFWQFVDIPDSTDYLNEQKDSIDDSSIRPRLDWMKNINYGLRRWKAKHGVALNEIPR